MEDFLGQLLHFQHFRQFINTKIDKLKNRSLERDLFDNEVMAYEEGWSVLLEVCMYMIDVLLFGSRIERS